MPPDKQFIRLREARRLYTLVGECLAVGQDGVAWRWRLVKAIRRLLGADMTYFADHQIVGVPESPNGWLRPLSLIDDWEDDEHRPLLWDFIRRGRYERAPFGHAIEACETSKVARRIDVVRNTAWRASSYYREHTEPAGLDDFLIGVSRMSEDTIQMLFVQKRIDAEPFPREAVQLVECLWSELRRLQPRQLAGLDDSAFMDLPQRMMQVLACLLSGYTARETAELIGVSEHTIQEHVRRLYKRSGASNRAELAARYRTITPVLMNTPLEELPDVGERIAQATRSPWPTET